MDMENQNEVVVFDTAKKIWSQIAKNGVDLDPKFELEVHKKLLSIFQVGDYYHYIFNCCTQQMEFVHNNINGILGYNSDEFSIDLLLKIIHPEDLVFFVNFENTVTNFFNCLSPEKILKYKVRYDYRVKKKDGNYIRILQQVVTIQTDENGAVIRTLGIHTDISHLKKNNDMALSFIGLEGEPSYHNVAVLSVLSPTKEVLSKRGREILELIIQGYNSFSIASLLCISKHTVDSHRKNILKKTNCGNVSELISKAFQNGWC
jgi:DNA-binding CsgD family transcriptional regulator